MRKYRGPIKSEEDYQSCLRALGLMLSDEVDPGALGELIWEYEEVHVPIGFPSAAAAIRFRCEQLGVSPSSALKDVIGSSGKISEVLSGKVPLNLRMVRGLNQKLGIPLEVLCASPLQPGEQT